MSLSKLSLYCVCLVWVVSLSVRAQNMPPAQVEVVTLKSSDVAPMMELKGNVLALQDAILSAEVEGALEHIELVGSTFEQGQSIALINRDRAKRALDRRQAELASLQADLRFRQSEVARFETLASRDNASKTQLQRELANKEMLEQQILTAKANIADAQLNLSKTSIEAPFNGVLAQRHANIGEFIRVGDPLVRLVNTANKDVVLPTPIRLQHLLSNGMRLHVSNRGVSTQLPIRTIVPIGDLNSRMVEVRLDASQSELVVGDSVSVSVPKAEAKMAIAVPRDALVIRGSQTFVYRVTSDNMAEQVAVEIDYAEGDWLVFKGGVNAGDRVIVRGAERLQPNAPVSPTESERYFR